jgi:hypothetical protein
MPGFLLHQGAQVICPHFGQATPTVPNPRVLVSGMPIVTQASPYVVAGCTFPAMTSGAPPCVSAQWLRGAARVFSNGQPVLLLDSQSLTNNAVPLQILVTQTRVSGI